MRRPPRCLAGALLLAAAAPLLRPDLVAAQQTQPVTTPQQMAQPQAPPQGRPEALRRELRESQARLDQIRRERSDLQRQMDQLRSRVHDASSELSNIQRQVDASASALKELDFQFNFLALCSQIMRRILVDHARHRAFAKRGGKALCVTLDEALLKAESRGIELLALEEALGALTRIDGRKGRVVELRYFGGLNIEEIAEVLAVSPGTVKRDWRFARAWLLAELTGKPVTRRCP